MKHPTDARSFIANPHTLNCARVLKNGAGHGTTVTDNRAGAGEQRGIDGPTYGRNGIGTCLLDQRRNAAEPPHHYPTEPITDDADPVQTNHTPQRSMHGVLTGTTN